MRAALHGSTTIFGLASGCKALNQPPRANLRIGAVRAPVSAGTKRRDLPTPSQRSKDAGGPPPLPLLQGRCDRKGRSRALLDEGRPPGREDDSGHQ